MARKAFRIVDIFWSELEKVKFRRADNTYSIRPPSHLKAPGGVYQIYGHHTTYGRNALLYIGRAADFGQRMTQHFAGRFWHHVNLECAFGTLHTNGKPTDSDDLIKEVEKLLIAIHSPALNTVSKKQVPDSCRDLLVCNRDWRQDLAPEVSGHLFFHP